MYARLEEDEDEFEETGQDRKRRAIVNAASVSSVGDRSSPGLATASPFAAPLDLTLAAVRNRPKGRVCVFCSHGIVSLG